MSFTFDCPEAAVLHELHPLGIHTAVTVTSSAEARTAADRGARILIVQGPDGGGHRATFDPATEPGTELLPELISAIKDVVALPLIAGGGITTRAQVQAILSLDVVTVQIGTALLPADDAGTIAAHRSALQDAVLTETRITRASTGRPAHGLHNAFMDDHPYAGHAYPQIHHMTAPLRAAAAADDNLQGLHRWADTGYRTIGSASTADIIAALIP